MLLFADDFGGYGTNTALMLNGLYADISSGALTEDPDPNITGIVYAADVNPINATRLRRVLPNAVTTAGFAFRLWISALPQGNANSIAFGFSNNANALQIAWRVSSTGRIIFSNSGGDIAASVSPALVANAWNHVEVKCVASTSAGTIEIRVNGVPVPLDVSSGLNTGTQYSQFRMDNPNSTTGPRFYIKTLVAWDSSGTSNNDFFGTVDVIGRTTNVDVALNWTPSTGTAGWSLLDNSPPQDGTDYLSAGDPPPAASLFGLTPLPEDVTSVRAMVLQLRGAKVDGGDGNLQGGMKSGASTALGANRPITTAFTYYEDVFAIDPATSAPWTPAAADAVQIQINRTV